MSVRDSKCGADQLFAFDNEDALVLTHTALGNQAAQALDSLVTRSKRVVAQEAASAREPARGAFGGERHRRARQMPGESRTARSASILRSTSTPAL